MRPIANGGAHALVHGNRGRPSPRRLPPRLRRRNLRLAQGRYAGVNHSHFRELLAEREGLQVARTTLRRILGAAGLHSPRTRRPPRHRRWRERMPHAGMLVQLDGSHHAWLEGHAPRLVLLVAVDDATGQVLGATFRDQEDAHGYLVLLRQLVQTYGLPLAVYTDRHGLFARSTRTALTLDEQLQGGPAPTQLGRVFQELGIRWVPASSPQAKGRIERLFATLQDRLVTELRLARIRDRDRANAFLPGFVQAHNVRFSQAAAQPGSAYRPWPLTWDPEASLCFKYLRMVAKDNTVTVGPHRLQLLPGPGGRSYAHIRVEVREHLDGRLTAAYHGQSIPSAHLTLLPDRLTTIPARKHPRVKVRRSPDSRTARKVPHPPQARRPRPWKPSPTHPWHVLMRQEMRRKTLREAGVTFSSAT